MVHQTIALPTLPTETLPKPRKSTSPKAKRKSTRSYLGVSGKSNTSKTSKACSFCGSSETKFRKCSTKSDAQAWGRTAAVLNWSLDELEYEVEDSLHDVARASYEKRLVQLNGAPF